MIKLEFFPKINNNVMKIKNYIQFLESNRSDIFLYPEKQKVNIHSTSILLIPGGHKGDPDNDFKYISRDLKSKGYNVYSLEWPEVIDLNSFADKIASQIDLIKTPFILAGYSFGFPIAWKIAQKIENNPYFQKLLISIDGTALVDDVNVHLRNSISGNPPRKIAAKSLKVYQMELAGDNSWESKQTQDDYMAFYYEWSDKLNLEMLKDLELDASSAEKNEIILWKKSSQEEYNNWKQHEIGKSKKVLEFLGKKIPSIEEIKKLSKGTSPENVWIVYDREDTGDPIFIKAVKDTVEFFIEQVTSKTGFTISKKEKLNRTKVVNICADIIKNGRQEKVSNSEVIQKMKDGSEYQVKIDTQSLQQKIEVIKDCDHNTICDKNWKDVCDIIERNFSNSYNEFLFPELIPGFTLDKYNLSEISANILDILSKQPVDETTLSRKFNVDEQVLKNELNNLLNNKLIELKIGTVNLYEITKEGDSALKDLGSKKFWSDMRLFGMTTGVKF